MLKNDQTYIKNLAEFTPHNFESMFGHFSTLWIKGLKAKWNAADQTKSVSILVDFKVVLPHDLENLTRRQNFNFNFSLIIDLKWLKAC